MTKTIKGQQGFSLVELMVVVAIIGILAAIAIPNFQKFSMKARQSEVKSNLSAIYSAEQAFRAEWLTYSTNFMAIGYSPTGNLRYDHGFSTDFPAATDYPAGFSKPSKNYTTADAFCDRAGTGCKVIKVPFAPGKIATANMTGSYFIAQGRGDLDGVDGDDIWTIDSGKNLLNPTSDINK